MSKKIDKPICIDCGRSISWQTAIPIRWNSQRAYLCRACAYAGVPELAPRLYNPPRWKIIGRHKWVDGANITESYREDDDRIRRFTATIRGWQNFRIFEGKTTTDTAKKVVTRVKNIRDRIDRGDETVFQNPSPSLEALKAGVRIKERYPHMDVRVRNPNLYQAFHGNPPSRVRRVNLPVPKKNSRLVKIGRLEAVIYAPEKPSKLADRHFEHQFGDEGGKIMLPDKPILATDAEGRHLYIIPDKARPKMTERGIIG